VSNNLIILINSVNAYTRKSFSYSEEMPSQYPYVKDNSFYNDILRIAKAPLLQNSWLDSYVEEGNPSQQNTVIETFNHLSLATRDLIKREIWKNCGSPDNAEAESFGEQFLQANPVHKNVRLAFRTVFEELVREVRDYPVVSWAKVTLYAQNIFQVLGSWFRNLQGYPAIAAT
jgi:hypothetical protein